MENEEWVTGNIELKVHGIPVEFEVTVPAAPIKPQRMLPIFHQMANSFVDVGVQVIEAEGKKISCKAGCGACCRQPVPISKPEIYQIAALVDELPEPRKSEIKKRFADAAAHFHSVGWFERFLDHQKHAGSKDPDEATKEGMGLVLEYFYEGIPCPFLENESCSIHEVRPVVCREYLVTTPAENCSTPSQDSVNLVQLLIKPSKALKKLGLSEQPLSYGMPILSRALEIAEIWPDDIEERPGPDWLKEFIEELTHSPIDVRSDEESGSA